MNNVEEFTYPLKSGIRSTPEFAKKKLADFAVNIGVKCSHGCTYCSAGTSLRMHDAFKEANRSPFESGYSIIDPEMPEKVAREAKSGRNRGLIQLCTTVDAWAPEAKKYDLGRLCLEAILAEPGWTVRILTKNASVVYDFDLIQKYKDRVLVGISLTGTPDKEDVMSVVEPYASPISERIEAMNKAHQMGLRTYGMLCPLLPGVADGKEQIDELVRIAANFGAEEIFSEAVNGRGNGLTKTEEALRMNGFEDEAEAVSRIRRTVNWSPYAASLVENLQLAMKAHMSAEQLRYLLYPKNLREEDLAKIKRNDEGVIWL